MNSAKISITDKKTLLENIISLSTLQALNYILPLVTLPYLFRVLGPEKFGLIAFSQAVMQYFIIFTDFGFNFSATKEIASFKQDAKKVNLIFSSVMIVKVLFTLISLLVLVLILFFSPKFRSDSILYLLAFGSVVGNTLFPLWFFQGMEKMKYITILNSLAKIFFTICLFTFIKHESDYIYVPLFNSMGFLVAGILGLYLVYKQFKIHISLPTIDDIKITISQSVGFFISRLSLSVYTITNTVILGILTSNEITGYYAAADKLIRAVEGLIQPIIDVIYPFMNRTKNKQFFRRLFVLVFITGLILCFLGYIFAEPFITLIYGEKFDVLPNIFRLYIFQIPITYVSAVIGIPLLVVFGQGKLFNISNVIGCFIQLVGLIIIAPIIDIYKVVILTLCTQGIVLLYRAYGVFAHRLWKD